VLPTLESMAQCLTIVLPVFVTLPWWCTGLLLRLANVVWIAWCLAVLLSRVASPGVDGPVFDCVTAVWVASTDMDCLVFDCVAVP
jgi:hypothetical protein